MSAGRLEQRPGEAGIDPRSESYRLLSSVYHQFLLEESLAAVLESIADALRTLVPYDTISIYEADETKRVLIPVLARDPMAQEVMATRPTFGQGITGWAVENRQPVLANEAHLDHRVNFIPGTSMEPEALICVPLIARGSVKGALNIYRQHEAVFSEDEFELARSFADAAALAIDNAHIRAALEYQAQTDHLTGLYNHRYFHERLRSEVSRASRAHDSVALVMLDIDDFKKLNDMFGHAVGDQVLLGLSEVLQSTIRASDVACRIGGEEFAVVLPSCDSGDALGLARRLRDRLAVMDFDPAGSVTVSIGIAQGPEHAMNPRELVSCAEAAMMTAKARGKDRSILFSEDEQERPTTVRDDVRSIAHLKMLQSLAGKLNRLNEVRQIAETISTELRTLIDYHSCRVYIAEGEDLIPAAIRGDIKLHGTSMEALATRFGEGVTGRAASMGKAISVESALECDFAVRLPGTDEVEESLVAVPMLYGARVNGVVTISKLGRGQFDDDDVRLLEVLAGQASVALENARLYEAQRRETENARSLLALAEQMSSSATAGEIGQTAISRVCKMVGADQASLWLLDESLDAYVCSAHHGFTGDTDSFENLRYVVSQQEAHRLVGGNRQPFLLEPDEIEGKLEAPARLKLKSVAIVPLPGADPVQGWIAIRRPPTKMNIFTDERMRLLAGIAHQVGTALQKAELYRDQKETADIASALLGLSAELTSAETIDDILQRVVARSASILGAPRTWVWLQEAETGDLVPEAWWGIGDQDRDLHAGMRLSASEVETFLGSRSGPFVLQPQESAHLIKLDTLQEGLTHAVAPIRLDGRLGCIVIAAPALGEYTFSERKMRLLAGIADQAKLALNNANNFEILESTFLSTIEALANALEAKDEYTSSHTRSIVDMSLEVGEEMGLEGKGLKRLEMGALFHDIGKIGIPSSILLKPGPLTDGERDLMNTHPELGERILAPIDRLVDVRPIVRACHEHFDGSGYPDARAGGEIPLEARIILVCDAYDAMTTDRPYRKRLSLDEACRRLGEASGTQFDPEVVEVFLRLFDQRQVESA